MKGETKKWCDDMNIDKVLKDFVKVCKEKFGKDLVSIILFGSYARGTAREGSDIDLLVIAKNLPKDIFRRLDLLDDFVVHAIKKHHVRVVPIFYEPEDFSTEFINPLVYGILTGYRILFGRPFWSAYIEGIKPRIRATKPVFIGEKRWEIEKLI
jgi:hypothetical protein